MKKILFISVFLSIITLCLVPSFALAQTAVVEQESVHFINPTAIAAVNGYLYVADNVDAGKCALLCFLTGDAPQLKFTYEIDKTVTGLADNGEDALYVICGKEVLELDLNFDSGLIPSIANTYDKFDTEVIDVAYAKNVNSNDKTLYALTSSQVLRKDGENFTSFAVSQSNLSNTKNLLSVVDGETHYLYFLYNGRCGRYNISQFTSDTELNLPNGFVPQGMMSIAGNAALYDAKNIYAMDKSGTPREILKDYAEYNIADVAYVNADCEKLFVLNNNNQIESFKKIDGVYVKSESATIGSDVVEKDIPSSYDSFTLVNSTGYPTNIIYKTKDGSTSVENIITDATEYIILGYEGAETSRYYYVMTNGKFGWVKKSDNVALPQDDPKLKTVDTEISNQNVGFVAKFTTLNAVYVYDLPRSDSSNKAVTQTASDMKDIRLLQKFIETGNGEVIEWYYVEYDNGGMAERGFVRRESIGSFRSTQQTENVAVLGGKKINSSLFEAVKLYAYKEMNESDVVSDADGNPIKLYSGDRVTLVSVEGDAALVMRLRNDGSKDFGWMDASRLIEVNSITTNAIVGLSLLAFALALTAVLVAVFIKRKKRIKANKD